MLAVVDEKMDPRVKRTRKLILDAFGSLLGEKGFDQITVQDVAARATVNRATFYSHFDDKYKLLDQYIGEDIKRYLESKLSRTSAFNAANLKTLVVAVCDHLTTLEEHCKVSYKQFEPYIETQIQKQLYAFLYTWLKPLQTSKGTSAEMTASIMSWSIFGAALQWNQMQPKAMTSDQVADKIITLIMKGVANLPELQLKH